MIRVRINKLEIPPEIFRGLHASFEVEHSPQLGQFEIE
jgi:hypothetical protein